VISDISYGAWLKEIWETIDRKNFIIYITENKKRGSRAYNHILVLIPPTNSMLVIKRKEFVYCSSCRNISFLLFGSLDGKDSMWYFWVGFYFTNPWRTPKAKRTVEDFEKENIAYCSTEL
jgi:hypothetical protein